MNKRDDTTEDDQFILNLLKNCDEEDKEHLAFIFTIRINGGMKVK